MVRVTAPWHHCVCGHTMGLHDVEDFEDRYPTCCVDDCSGKCPRPPVERPSEDVVIKASPELLAQMGDGWSLPVEVHVEQRDGQWEMHVRRVDA